MSDLSLTHLVLPLPVSRFQLLVKLITDPDRQHATGGYQNRKQKWRLRLNEAMRSIELDADDIEWIRRQIINRNGGGWQRKTSDIFAGTHPTFSRLPIKPRKKPEQRRHRRQS